MTKKMKKFYLSMGTILTVTGTITSVVSCSSYKPSRNDLQTRNFLSGKQAYNKALADYYLDVVNAMYSDKDNTVAVNLDNLRFDTFQWLITTNALKDNFYWGTQRNTWIQSGTFIDLKDPNLNTIAKNQTFVDNLFTTDTNGNYILKNDSVTFNSLQVGNTASGDDKGSGVIMSVNRQLFSMGYLLLTKKQDVQNWLIGDPNDPSSKGKGTIRTDEKNEGQYFFIDYLRQSKPFIMWKNQQVSAKDASLTFTGTDATNSTKFNALSTTVNSQDALSTNLTLAGCNVVTSAVPQKITDLNVFKSYAGFQTTNPFTKNGSNPRHGDIDPKDSYMKTTPGGHQGWVNQDGQILQNQGNAVNTDANTRNYAYIQQLLPTYDTKDTKYPDGAFRIPDWMTTQDTTNATQSVKALWNVAFQISFYSTDLLSSAKNYWVHNGYSLKAFIPTLDDNLSPAHIAK